MEELDLLRTHLLLNTLSFATVAKEKREKERKYLSKGFHVLI